MERIRLLLTGASGYLGHHLVRVCRAHADLIVASAGRAASDDVPLDLSADRESIVASCARFAPHIVIHAAARSSMRECAIDQALADRVNAHAVAALAALDARLVHVSTDLVFDGRAAPYLPTASPRPLSAYGRSKARGEDAALCANGNALVVRVPLLYGPSHDGQRGASDMLRPDRALGLFTNEFRTPLDVRIVAERLLDAALDATRTGVAHFAGEERLSRFDFAMRWAQRHSIDASRWFAAVCVDPERPRDVSLLE